MDKAQEKIIKEAFELLEYQVELQSVGNDLSKYGKSKLRDLMAKLGYCKLPKEQLDYRYLSKEKSCIGKLPNDIPSYHLYHTNVDGVVCCMYCGERPKEKPPLLRDIVKEIQMLTDNPTWEDLIPLRRMLQEIELG